MTSECVIHYEGCSFILVTCLNTFPVDNLCECCSNVVKALSFLGSVSMLLLSDARSFSNHSLKQGTVMALRCFPVNLQFVISITTSTKML